MDRFKLIKSDTRSWRSGRVKLSLIGVPDKPVTYYILLEKDFFGNSPHPPQRFLLRALDWVNLKRLVDGPGEADGWGIEAEWSYVHRDQQIVELAARTPELVEAILSSPNLGKFSGASWEALDRLATRVFEVKKENLDLIFRRLAESSTQSLQGFSGLLSDLRLNQVSLLSGLVYQKIKIIDLLEKTVTNTGSSEFAVHTILESNPWILGKRFEIVQSDKPLADYLQRNVKEDPGMRKRPDLIIKRVPHSDEVMIIELKAPGIKLKAEHIGQVLTYKALIKRHRPNVGTIHCFLLGYEKSDTFAESSDVQITTFGELISELRDEFREYSEVLQERRQDVTESVGVLMGNHEDEPPF